MYGYPNIGTDLALGTRTIFASIPYFLDGFVTSITDAVAGDRGSGHLPDQRSGRVLPRHWSRSPVTSASRSTQAIARVVAHLTGAGTIPPQDQPLPPPAAGSPSPAQLLLLPAAAVA